MWSFRQNRLLEPVDITVANLMAVLGRYHPGKLSAHYRRGCLQVLKRFGNWLYLEEYTESATLVPIQTDFDK